MACCTPVLRAASTWPHEYLVREDVDENFFLALVLHIRNYGHLEKFYDTTNTYYGESGKVYWTMDASVEETTIINRCDESQTYEYRLANDDLPKQRTDS